MVSGSAHIAVAELVQIGYSETPKILQPAVNVNKTVGYLQADSVNN